MVDGTFGLIPGRLDVLNVRSSQILNILCDFKGAAICILTVVMSARKLPLYQKIFEWVVTDIPTFRPLEIMSDFVFGARSGIISNK